MKQKLIPFSLLALLAVSCASEEPNTNYSDTVDANNTPSYLEEREDEYINASDPIDDNAVPAELEEREEQEELEYRDQLNDDVYWDSDIEDQGVME